MTRSIHPSEALFEGERQYPIIPSCEHFAGNEKLIRKAFQLQQEYGSIFDITCDCEDGAPTGQEESHVRMVASLIASSANIFHQAGIRIHDPAHPFWKADVDIALSIAGADIAYITVPKATSASQLEEVVSYVRQGCVARGIGREIPIHALVETHGALAEVRQIAAIPWMQVLDFGLMDFVSAHSGAIPAAAMRSPGQFDHRLIARAKTELVAAALHHGLVPSHNVCLDLKDGARVHSDATRARQEFGFLRMWSIYPAQIQPIIEAMRPDFSEIEDAEAILLAAQTASWGPIQYKGELHDRATYRYFWSILQRACMTGVEISPAGREAFFS